MKTKLLQDAKAGANGVRAETVSHRLIRERAMELAAEHGRSAQDASKSDWDQARRELVGAADPDVKDVVLEAASEAERWDPLPGSAGHQATVLPGDDEDDEGRSNAERLVEEGIAEAEQDQAIRAEKADTKNDR